MFLVMALSLTFAAIGTADKGKPSFSPMVYADGEVWGTKGAHVLPAARERNIQSFDKLFVITNGAVGQLPVGEAGPRNFDYNGGRWYTHTVTWTKSPPVPILKSYTEIKYHLMMGNLTITPGSPPGGPPDFFECPLLPVKMQ
jgi:hypothetical protein